MIKATASVECSNWVGTGELLGVCGRGEGGGEFGEFFALEPLYLGPVVIPSVSA